VPQCIISPVPSVFLISQIEKEEEERIIVDFDERLRYVLELKINKLRIAMQKSNTPLEGDMLMIRIQALEWVQGRIQDLILNNVMKDWPVYNTK
jgi:hypothetical protein